MHFSLVANAAWAVAFGSTLLLMLVMLWRGRWREFPVLTLWMAFLALRSVALFLFYVHDSKYWYTRTFMGGLWIDFILQLAVILEIARIVLRPTGTWVRDARLPFALLGFAGVVLAAVLAWWVSPPPWSVRRVWEIRANLFTSLVICELFVLMSLTANRLGLGWRSHVMAVAQGLTAWSTLMVFKTAVESFLGTQRLYNQLEQIRSFIYVGAICWMALQLWRDEPERGPISADLHEYILALHRRVEYDLRRLDARQ
jgi:hypothetical protein